MEVMDASLAPADHDPCESADVSAVGKPSSLGRDPASQRDNRKKSPGLESTASERWPRDGDSDNAFFEE